MAYVVLLADTETGLQNSINRLEEFCNGWELSINIEKKYLSSTNLHTCSSQFVVHNTHLEQVKEYKYLGVMLSENPYLNLHRNFI